VNRVELHRVVNSRLRQIGQRYTTKRRQLVDLLQDAEQPLHIPEILDADPTQAQSSVYRNLSVLVSVGVVERIVTSDPHGRYELAEDFTHHHHHLICKRCGIVRNIVLPDEVEDTLDGRLALAADAANFVFTNHKLDLVGLCGECA
jgi:Fur family transcriptional regulator, ferric uptake regulator